MFKSLLLSDLDVTVIRIALTGLKGREAELIYDVARKLVETETKEFIGTRQKDEGVNCPEFLSLSNYLEDVDMRYDDAAK